MPKFWTTWNYKRSREATVLGNKPSTNDDIDFPYYTKSDMAIEEIAKRIYEKLKEDKNDKERENKVTKVC